MLKQTTIASLVLLFAATTLAANSGCSKSDKAKNKPTAKQPGTTPTADTKLLALKFHHDN